MSEQEMENLSIQMDKFRDTASSLDGSMELFKLWVLEFQNLMGRFENAVEVFSDAVNRIPTEIDLKK